MPERVKYPFEVDGRWVLRYHIPYDVVHEDRDYSIVATIFARPTVHGRIQIACAGELVALHDDLVVGSVVEITGDRWRVDQVEYRKHLVLEREANRA